VLVFCTALNNFCCCAFGAQHSSLPRFPWMGNVERGGPVVFNGVWCAAFPLAARIQDARFPESESVVAFAAGLLGRCRRRVALLWMRYRGSPGFCAALHCTCFSLCSASALLPDAFSRVSRLVRSGELRRPTTPQRWHSGLGNLRLLVGRNWC